MVLCAICKQDKGGTIEVLYRNQEDFMAPSRRPVCQNCKQTIIAWKIAPLNQQLVYYPPPQGSPYDVPRANCDTLAALLTRVPEKSSPHLPATAQVPADPQGGTEICGACRVAGTQCHTCRKKFCRSHLYNCPSHFDPIGVLRCKMHADSWKMHH